MQASRESGDVCGLVEVVSLGVVILLLGVVRFVASRHFRMAQAAYCLISIPAALLLLMILDYTLHHARIVCFILLIVVAVLVIRSPAFCVGLGLVVVGMVANRRP